MTNVLQQITTGQLLKDEQAYQLAAVPATELPALLTAATLVREQAFGAKVSLCAIVNAKSGLCPEDCAFCAQSAHHATTVAQYPLLDEQTLLAYAAVRSWIVSVA